MAKCKALTGSAVKGLIILMSFNDCCSVDCTLVSICCYNIISVTADLLTLRVC